MEQSVKSLMDSIAKLAEHLHSMEQKVDKFSGELSTVQTKVDLAMSSISLVQQEQVQVAKLLKSGAGASATVTSAGVMRPSPSGRASSSVVDTPPPPPPPPPPSSQLLRQQVNSTCSNTSTSDVVHLGSDRSDSCKQWISKMDFPPFDGVDARI
jgi:hypothetical protein